MIGLGDVISLIKFGSGFFADADIKLELKQPDSFDWRYGVFSSGVPDRIHLFVNLYAVNRGNQKGHLQDLSVLEIKIKPPGALDFKVLGVGSAYASPKERPRFPLALGPGG